MIKQLEEVSIDQVNNNESYIVLIKDDERFHDHNPPTVVRGKGEEVVKYLKEIYGYEDEENEDEERSFQDFFNDVNGDGWPLVSIFNI